MELEPEPTGVRFTPQKAMNLHAIFEMVTDNLTCPIQQEIPHDPIVAKDGHVYGKEALFKWLRTHRTSPMTREPLEMTDITDAKYLRELCNLLRDDRDLPCSYRYFQIEKARRTILTMNSMSDVVRERGYTIYGSYASRKVFDDGMIRSFYIECVEKNAKSALLMYDRHFHTESYKARTRLPGDLDIYLPPNGDIDRLIWELKDISPIVSIKEQKMKKSEGYRNSKWVNNIMEFRNFVVKIPGYRYKEKLEIKLDITKGKLEDIPYTPFPSIHRHIFLQEGKIGIIGREDRNGLIDVLTHHSNLHQTFTSSILSKDEDVFGLPGDFNSVVKDIECYMMRLAKTLYDGWEIKNISLALNARSNIVATRTFHDDGKIFLNHLELDLHWSFEHTSFWKLRKGILKSKLGYIYILSDPDFRLSSIM